MLIYQRELPSKSKFWWTNIIHLWITSMLQSIVMSTNTSLLAQIPGSPQRKLPPARYLTLWQRGWVNEGQETVPANNFSHEAKVLTSCNSFPAIQTNTVFFRPWTEITNWPTKPRALDSPYSVQGFKTSLLFIWLQQVDTNYHRGWLWVLEDIDGGLETLRGNLYLLHLCFW